MSIKKAIKAIEKARKAISQLNDDCVFDVTCFCMDCSMVEVSLGIYAQRVDCNGIEIRSLALRAAWLLQEAARSWLRSVLRPSLRRNWFAK